jgi:succinate dehydrogenase / fumarate reductase cytochrome b subunit
MAINNNRPTSPHLQVYKLPLTGIISISHRMTGAMLSRLAVFVYIVSALADGAEAYSDMQNIMGLWPVKVMY